VFNRRAYARFTPQLLSSFRIASRFRCSVCLYLFLRATRCSAEQPMHRRILACSFSRRVSPFLSLILRLGTYIRSSHGTCISARTQTLSTRIKTNRRARTEKRNIVDFLTLSHYKIVTQLCTYTTHVQDKAVILSRFQRRLVNHGHDKRSLTDNSVS